MSGEYSEDGAYVKTEHAVRQMLGAQDDVIELVAAFVDKWLVGADPELVDAILSLKGGKLDQ